MDPRAMFGTMIGATGRGATFEFIPVGALNPTEEALLPTDAMSWAGSDAMYLDSLNPVVGLAEGM